MTPTPDARPVSEERLAELIGDVGAVADLVDGHWREVHSALRELQSRRSLTKEQREALEAGAQYLEAMNYSDCAQMKSHAATLRAMCEPEKEG